MRLLISTSLLLIALTSLVHSQEELLPSNQELVTDIELDFGERSAPLTLTELVQNANLLQLQVANKKKEHLVPSIEADSSLELQELSFVASKAKDDYEMELEITFKDQISLREEFCVFSVVYANETQIECLESFRVILKKPNAVLRINRKYIKSAIIIKYRLVICGCDKHSGLRDLKMKPGMPTLIHYSDQDCIYRIDGRMFPRDMLKVTVDNFPEQLQECRAFVQIASAADAEDLVGTAMAAFDSMDTVKRFGASVFQPHRFTLLKLTNCFYNSEAIALKLDRVRKNSGVFPKNQMTGYQSMPSNTAHWHYEINQKNSDVEIGIEDFMPLSTDRLVGSLVVYGVDQFNRLNWYKFNSSSIAIPFNKLVLRGYERVSVDFYRHTDTVKCDMKIKVSVKPVNVEVRKFSNPSGDFKSQHKILGTIRGKTLRFEIETPVGTQIILNLTEFNNNYNRLDFSPKDTLQIGQPNSNFICNSDDYIIVNLNKSTDRLGSLYTDNTNPKICDSIQRPMVFRTFSNKLVIMASFSNRYQDKQPFISFSYSSESICGSRSSGMSDVVIYSSDEDATRGTGQECVRQIEVPSQNRIIMYRMAWKLNETGHLFDQTQPIEMINGKEVCKDSDSMVLTESLAKNNTPSDFLMNENVYCMNNPLNTLVSKENKFFMKFQPLAVPSNQSLIFETGYFGYKHIYNGSEEHNNIFINFADIIPEHIADKQFNYTSSFEIRIRVPDTNKYFMPVFSECQLNIKQGKITIKTNNGKEYPFSNKMCNEGSLIGEMNTELILSFDNVDLNELRGERIRFRVDYKLLSRVFTTNSGTLESNNFKFNYLSRRDDLINYEWKLNVDADQFIELNIDTLTNVANIQELTITDDVQNMALYAKDEIVKNSKNMKKPFFISSSQITIRFSHVKNIPRNSNLNALAYFKAHFVARPRVIHASLIGGAIDMVEAFVSNPLDWLLVAPKDHFIVVKIKQFIGKGQLKFSLLNDDYIPKGIYHYDKMQVVENEYEKKTTVVVSKNEWLKIEYQGTSTNQPDVFSLVYTVHKKVLTAPSGILRPFFNEFVSPVIPTPKLTEQKWTLRAPYGKTLSLYYHFIDLFADHTCSKSSLKVTIPNFNEDSMITRCGRFMSDLQDQNLTKALIATSKTNELDLMFQTHDYNEVVYYQDGNQTMPFKGFELFYMFNEDIGDCYFQRRSNFKCGYESLRGSWTIERANVQMADTSDYNSIVCFDCHLKAAMALSDATNKQILQSPVIDKSKEYLKFTYQLSENAQMYVHLVYENQEPILLRREPASHLWKHVTIRLGKSERDFRIQFTLDSAQPEVESKTLEAPTLKLKSIQLFRTNFECESHEFPGVCDIGDIIPKLGLCKAKWTPCQTSPCTNNGLCMNQDDDYKCLCANGFTGRNCETGVDVCEANKCSTNSKCVPDANATGYSCQCEINYYGQFCESKFTPCKLSENPCNQLHGNGVCIDNATPLQPNNYTCQCSSVYTGAECETKRPVNCAISCQSIDKNARCELIGEETICQCSVGFRGEQCQENMNDCKFSPCQNNGTCVDGINAFTCECSDFHEGKYCEIAKVCRKCSPFGTQFCNHTSNECVCLGTHEGQFCEIQVDPCLQMPCFNNGTCFSSKVDKDLYKCQCPDGFTGARCQLEASECDKLQCLNGGSKICTAGSDVKTPCACAPNFDGKYCEIYHAPCDSSPCTSGGICSNTIDGFKCHCMPGMSGEFCQFNDLPTSCDNNLCENDSACMSVLDTYICICKAGTLGQYCEVFEDKCADNFCQNGACMAHEQGSGYSCLCYDGYEGQFCDKKINSCLNANCNTGKCIDTFDGYECLCPLGTSSNNFDDCSPLNYCSDLSSKCVFENTHSCVNTPAGNRCNCKKGYGGNKCELLLDICEFTPNACHNNGLCVPLGDGDYKCTNCDAGFTGKKCNEPIDLCSTLSPCQNGATCLSKVDDYFCMCASGFIGQNCSIKVEIECIKNKCQHNSICIPMRLLVPGTDSNGYSCECGEDYEGMYCEKQKDLCRNVQCEYGYCEKGQCVCNPRMPFCQMDQKCSNHTCENGGTCIDVIDGLGTKAHCLCPTGTTGRSCELSFYCEDMGTSLCGEGNECKLFNGNYRCECASPQVGHGCRQGVEDVMPVYRQQLRRSEMTRRNEECRFGMSKESQRFLLILAVIIIIFIAVGFLTGHRFIKKYKKKFDSRSDLSKYDGMYPNFYGGDSDFLTPKARAKPGNEILGNFSIPRPSIRTYV